VSSGAGRPPGAADAARELGTAVDRLAMALRAIPADAEAAAYESLRGLNEALAGLAGLLGEVPRIVGLGDPAPAVERRLEHSQAELAARQADIALYRKALDGLAATEKDLDEVTAQARALRERVTELEAARQTAGEIPRLRSLVQALEEDIAVLDAADGADVIARVITAAERLATMTDSQRVTAGEKAAGLAARAEAAARELRELQDRADTATADLSRRENDAEQLKTAHSDTLPMLAAWTQADLDVANGLRTVLLSTADTPLQAVQGELSGMRQRLAQLDEVLGPLLVAQAQSYEQARQVRSV
jgi:chromosome segregation ATPase